jgi:hypothetical protein
LPSQKFRIEGPQAEILADARTFKIVVWSSFHAHCIVRLTLKVDGGTMTAMSKMPEYDATAGFPKVHVDAFKSVACRNKSVISSRELNPLCTDLVLEGYAAKGFHIKAKTCDWGPMAGFVPEDYRFTKGKQKPRSATLRRPSDTTRTVCLCSFPRSGFRNSDCAGL